MMNITHTQFYIDIASCDENGEFILRIYKDGSQIQLNTSDDNAYINVNYRELRIIRDAINEVLNFDKNTKGG